MDTLDGPTPAIRSGDWMGAVFELSSMVVAEGAPYRPVGLIWLEVETGFVVGTTLVEPGTELSSAPEHFIQVTRAPMVGVPRIPARLTVSSPELATALRGRIGDVEVVVAPTPALDDAIASLTEHLMRRADDGRDDLTHLTEQVRPPLVNAFFTACARMYALEPWTVTPTDEFLSVACDVLGMEAGALCIVGQSGTAFGFSLFRTVADASHYLLETRRHASGELPMRLPAHIMVTFDHRDACPRVIVDEIAAHGWPVAGPDAYPSAFMIGADVERPLDRAELAAVTAIIEGMCALIETEPDLADAWDGGRECAWRGTIAVPGGEGASEVELGAPLWLPDVELDEGDALDARADDFLRGLAAQVGGDRDVLDWGDMLSHHAIAYHGALLHELTPAAFDDVLFGVVPRKVMAEPTDAPAIIAAARAWLAFAAELPEPGHAKALLAAMRPDAAQRLARLLADPQLFGPAKTLFAAGERAGFDMSSNEGIERFLVTTGGRLPELGPPSARRSTKPSVASANAKAKAKAKKAKKARKKTRAR